MVIKRKGNKLLSTLVYLFCLLALFFVFFFFQEKVKNAFYYFSAPIQKALWSLGQKAYYPVYSLNKCQFLASEMEQLKKSNRSLLIENVFLKRYQDENIEFRKVLNIGIEKDFDLIFSSIIGKGLSQDVLIIDKGLKQGVKKNMPVITSEKELVGKIGEAYNSFSKVYLVSKKEFIFDILIKDKNILAIGLGKGGQKTEIDMIPIDSEAEEGDIVITSGMGGIFPFGILVGKIESVEKSELDFYNRGQLSYFFDISKLNSVFIVKKETFDMLEFTFPEDSPADNDYE